MARKQRVIATLTGVVLASVTALAQESQSPGVRIVGDRPGLETSGMPLFEWLAALGRDTGVAFTVRGDPSQLRVSDSYAGPDLRRALQRALAPHSHLLVDHGIIASRRHVEVILLAAGTGQPPRRLAAARPFGETTAAFEEPVDELLAKVFSSAPAAERAAALDAVAYRTGGQGKGGGADQLLAQMLSDADDTLRSRAIETLKDTADRLPFAALAQVAREDASAALRTQALELLVERSESGEWREPIRVALNDPDPSVRARAHGLVLDWHLDLNE